MPHDTTGIAGRWRTAAAFTMTEVVVSVVLMLLALGLLLSAFVSSKRSAALAQTHLTALQLARSDAERIQTNVYSNIVSTSSSITNARVQYMLNRSVVARTNYKDVTISVQWTAPVSARLQAFTNYVTICDTN